MAFALGMATQEDATTGEILATIHGLKTTRAGMVPGAPPPTGCCSLLGLPDALPDLEWA
jgi:hypothetical protein